MMSQIRAAAEKRMALSAAQPSERVSWDQNVQGLGRRFHKVYNYQMLADGGGEGTELELIDDNKAIRLQQTDDDIGTTVYTAAVQISRLLETLEINPTNGIPPLKGSTVLELGSGTGLVGFVAAAMGARVLVTDIEGPVLENLRRNVEQLPQDIKNNITVAELKWGETLNMPESFHKIDLVLAVEVVYQKQFVPPLVETFRQLREHSPSASVLWSHDTRGRPGIALFRELTEPLINFKSIPKEVFPPQYLCKHVEVFTGEWKR